MSNMKKVNTYVRLANVIVGAYPKLYSANPVDSEYDAGKYSVQILISKGSEAEKEMLAGISKIEKETLNGDKAVIKKFLRDGDKIEEGHNEKPEKNAHWKGNHVFTCKCGENDPPALFRPDLSKSTPGEIITGTIVNASVQLYSTDNKGWKICFALVGLQKVKQGTLKIGTALSMEDKMKAFSKVEVSGNEDMSSLGL